MVSRSFEVTETPIDVSAIAGIVADTDYGVQNVGTNPLYISDAATAEDAVVLTSHGFIIDAAEWEDWRVVGGTTKTWIWSPLGLTRVVITDLAD